MLCMTVIALTGLYLYDDTADKRLHVFYLIDLSFITAALLYNDTFGSYLAALTAFLIIYVFYSRSGRNLTKKCFIPAIIFIAISLVNICGIIPGFHGLQRNLSQSGTDFINIINNAEEAKYAGTGRMTLWRDTLERIGERPIMGFGPMGTYWKNGIANHDSAHCEYLQITAFLGIPGLVLYLDALITLCIHHWKHIKELGPYTLTAAGMLVVYLISASFGNPLFCTAPYMWIFLGLTASGLGKNEENIWDTDVPLNKAINVQVLSVLSSVIIIGSLLISLMTISKNAEVDYEKSDFDCMKCAGLAAMEIIEDSDSNTTCDKYYFDAQRFILVAATDEKPTARGFGTTISTLGYFEEPTRKGQFTYIYDRAEDYTDKLIVVTIDREKKEAVIDWE